MRTTIRCRRRSCSSRPISAATSTRADCARTSRCSAGATTPMGSPTPRVRTTPGIGDFFIGLDVGAIHGCAIRRDFAPVCWGSNRLNSQASPLHACQHRPGLLGRPEARRPAAERAFDVISSGLQHTCALRRDGSASAGATAATSRPRRRRAGSTPLSAPGHCTRAPSIRTGSRLLGRHEMGQARRRRGSLQAISSGIRPTCALRSDGAASAGAATRRGSHPRRTRTPGTRPSAAAVCTPAPWRWTGGRSAGGGMRTTRRRRRKTSVSRWPYRSGDGRADEVTSAHCAVRRPLA